MPEKLDDWFNIIKPRWFVMDETEEAKREPGKIFIIRLLFLSSLRSSEN